MNILFGYRNLLFESGVTVTSGDEAGDHVDDNLFNPHPNSFWRADDLTASWVRFGSMATLGVPSLAALLYCTAMPLRNILKNANNGITAPDWTLANVSTNSSATGSDAPFAARITSVTETGGATEHTVSQTFDLARTTTRIDTGTNLQHEAIIFAKRVSGSRNVELEIGFNASAETASIEVDLGTGAVNTTNNSANVTINSSSVSASGAWYIIKIKATAALGSTSSVWTAMLKVYVLDASFNRTHAAGGQIDLAGPKLTIGAATNDVESYKLHPNGARWIYKAGVTLPTQGPDYDSGWLPVAPSASMRRWYDSQGWAHSWHVIPSSFAESNSNHLFEIHCNESAQVDLSNVYLGPYHQPSHGLADPADFQEDIEETIRSAEAGGGQEYRGGTGVKRVWRIRLPFATQAEAEGELHDLAIKLGRTQPVVVIRDPNETTYGQQGILYGYVDTWNRVGQWINADGTLRYTVNMTLRELLP